MIDWKEDLAILSDLSANIFAVFILVLIMLLQQPPQAGDRPPAPSVIEATADLAIVERPPLPAGSVIAHLHDRRASAEGISIDLFADRVAVVLGGAEILLPASSDPTMAPRLASLVQPPPVRAPVRLYVFDHRNYVVVTDTLSRAGRSWHEVSVPLALRGDFGRRTPGRTRSFSLLPGHSIRRVFVWRWRGCLRDRVRESALQRRAVGWQPRRRRRRR